MVVTELNVETLWGAHLAHFYTGTILRMFTWFHDFTFLYTKLHFPHFFCMKTLQSEFWQQISPNKYTLEKNSWHCCCTEQHLFLIRPGLEKGAKKFCLQSKRLKVLFTIKALKHFLLFFSSLCLFSEKHNVLHFSAVHKVEIVHDSSQQCGPSTFSTGTTNRSIEF